MYSLEEMSAWILLGIVPNRCDIYLIIILALGIVITNSKIISNNNAEYFMFFNNFIHKLSFKPVK